MLSVSSVLTIVGVALTEHTTTASFTAANSTSLPLYYRPSDVFLNDTVLIIVP